MSLLINGRFLSRPVTGVERYSHMLLQVVAREWPSARIMVPGAWKGAASIHGLPVTAVGTLRGHAWEQIALPRAVGANDVLLSPANTGPLRVKRQAVVVHDLAVIHHPEWFDPRFALAYRLLLPRLARAAARVITVSAASAQDIEQTFRISGQKVSVVPPFATGIRDEHPNRIGEPYILVVASRDPRKGIDRLVDQYTSLKDPGFRVVMVGRDVPSFAKQGTAIPPEWIQRPDVDDAELDALYAHAIALVQPSRCEGFGLPILEAISRNCPVIASDLGVFHENFGDAIHYVPTDDLRGLNEMITALKDPVVRGRWGAAGKTCAATYTTERMAVALHQAIAPLLRM